MGGLWSYISRSSDSDSKPSDSKEEEKGEIDYQPNNFLPRDTASCTQKNMLLIGTAGSGKSSFVNSMYTAVLGNYVERAKCGGPVGHVSLFFKKYDLSQCKEKLSTTMFQKHQLPVVYDMPGLRPDDIATDRFEEILKVILRGRLPLRTEVLALNSDEKAEIPECDDGVPIDRVVFVAAVDEELPTAHCETVMKVCEEVMGGEFTVFGILTKWDKLKTKEDKPKKHEKFLEMLHAQGTPYKTLTLSNYCGDFCKKPDEWQNRREIDDPLLKFLAEICRPEYDPEPTQETVPKAAFRTDKDDDQN